MLKLQNAGWIQRSAVALCAIALMLSAAAPSASAQSDDEKIVVVRAGRIITVSGDEILRGEIVIVDGKVSLVGKNLEYPANAKIIDAPDETVIPGMVNATSRYALPNYSRNGVLGNLKASDDVVLEDIEFDELLRAGFTAVAFNPPGNGIPGMASVYRTAGEDDERLIDDSAYLLIHMTNSGSHKSALRSALQKAQAEIDKVEKARKEWDEKQAKKKADEEAKKKAEEEARKKEGQSASGDTSSQQDDPPKPGDEKKNDDQKKKAEPEKFEPPKINPAYQHLVDMIQKKEGAWALVTLSSAGNVLHLESLLEEDEKWGELDLRYFVRLNGGSDIHYVLDRLAKNTRIILTNPILGSKPQTATRVNLVADMAYNGVDLALTPVSDSTSEFRRYRATLADIVRSGWTRKAMLSAAIAKPWELLGLGDQYGTIEKDKWGDLVFLDGDVLDPAARVTRIMIAGEVAWTEPLTEEPD